MKRRTDECVVKTVVCDFRL